MITEPKTIEDIKANRDEWADALESDSYQQAKETLRSALGGRQSFCCMGVACDITELGAWDGEEYVYRVPGEEWITSASGDLSENGALLELFGLDRTQHDKLVLANDKGATFPDIAQMIRDLPLPTEVSS